MMQKNIDPNIAMLAKAADIFESLESDKVPVLSFIKDETYFIQNKHGKLKMHFGFANNCIKTWTFSYFDGDATLVDEKEFYFTVPGKADELKQYIINTFGL